MPRKMPMVPVALCVALAVAVGSLLSGCDAGSSAATTTVATSSPATGGSAGTQPGQSTTTASSQASVEADLTQTSGISDRECFAQLSEGDPILSPKYRLAVELAMANGPGRPTTGDTVASTGLLEGPRRAEPVALSLPARQSAWTLPTAYLPFTTSATSTAVLKVNGPADGTALTLGTKYTLRWSYPIATATFTVSISTDNGKTYRSLATGLTRQRLAITLPNKTYDHCYFQVEVDIDPDVDGAIAVRARSGLFSIEPKRQPDSQPTYPPVPAPDLAYVKAGTLFINTYQGGVRWFRLDNIDTQAKKLVWQISSVPYSGLNSDALDPPGLLAAGEVSPSESEFAVDFTKIVSELTTGVTPVAAGGQPTAPYTLTKGRALLGQARYSFYMRVIALDAAGTLIGDAGRGISMGYGSPIVRSDLSDAIPGAALGIIETWSGERGMPTDGAYGYPYVHQVQKGFYAYTDDKYWDFEFRSTPERTVAAELQVATSPFGAGPGSYEAPAGLVHSLRWDKGTFTTNAWRYRVPLHEFTGQVEGSSSKPARYYLRMVFFTATEDPEVVHPAASQTQTIYYVSGSRPALARSGVSVTDYRPTETITVKSGVPFTSFNYYQPVQWEAPDSNRWFEVTRRIMADEMVLTVKTPKGVIYPYFTQFQKTGMSKEQYQALLDQTLPVGTYFPLTLTADAVADFLDLFGDIYGSFKKAYDEFKTAIVSYVVDNLPLIDDDTRDALARALTVAIDAGLAALGVPPTLPDFEALAANGFAYALDVAIQQECQSLGVDPNKITDAMRKELTKQFSAEMAELTRLKTVNPLGVGYLKPANAKQFRPASVTFVAQNFTDQVSPKGTLTIGYRALDHVMHFYKSVNLPIPPLQPHTDRMITVYLHPDIPYTGATDNKSQYDHFYFGDGGPCQFTFAAKYDVPAAKLLAEQQNLLPQDPSPFLAYEYVYDHDPTYRFSYEGPPSERKTGSDPSVSPLDFGG